MSTPEKRFPWHHQRDSWESKQEHTWRSAVFQRRKSLEAWMEKLLSDIDVSRSASAASFLELEAAARSSFSSGIDAEASYESSTVDSDESIEGGRTSEVWKCADDLGLKFPKESIERYCNSEVKRFIASVVRGFAEARTDIEDILARLDQETALNHYLTTKVKDLEMQAGVMKEMYKEKLEQALLYGQEKQTQVQWDLEELKRRCMETEFILGKEREEKRSMRAEMKSMAERNEKAELELGAARDELLKQRKSHEETIARSRADVRLLVKEVKTARSSQSKLKHDLDRALKRKQEAEGDLESERRDRGVSEFANVKLIGECDVLRSRLWECSVSFLASEEQDKPVDEDDGLDLLATSDNRVGLLLAEAQLLAQDVENVTAGRRGRTREGMPTDDKLRRLVTDMFIENATQMKQVNSVLRTALTQLSSVGTEADGEEAVEDNNGPTTALLITRFLNV